MKKVFTAILLIFICHNVFSQIKVKENSFHQINGFVMLDKNDHYDDNNRPMALIKISTENIKAEERRKFIFKGNMATYFDVHFEPGEIWLYLSTEATFIEIIHDDYGKTEFVLPYDLKPFCGYEMVVQRENPIPEPDPVYQSAYLIVSADQDDAIIYIDGEEAGVKEAQKRFEVGSTHTWKIECELYHSESGTVTLNERTEINKTLRPNFGYINIKTSPEQGAKVFVDGKLIGDSPLTTDKLKSGSHTVKVMKDMYKTTEQTFVVSDGQTTNADVRMDADFVTLTVNTDSDSDIYIDDEYKGKGKWTGRISDGTHVLEARKLNHRPSKKNVQLVIGKDETYTLENPQPINGSLDISSNPMRAEIYIDGESYGQTPNYINNIIIGTHELKLQKQGCATLTKTISIKEGETLTLNETLSTGKEISISTGQNGDKIYVDGNYVGLSPLNINIAYGSHEIKATRGNQTAKKNIDVAMSPETQKCVLAFGRLIRIISNAKGDDIYVDGKKVGTTPMEIDFSLAKHEVEVRRGKLYETKTLTIDKNSSASYSFVPKKEPLDKYLDRGVSFITLNAACSSAPQFSLGLTFGRVKKVGWYVSAMSGLDFTGYNTLDKDYKDMILTGETASTRLSVMGGLIARIAGPVYFKVGAGYGMIVRSCETIYGDYVEYKPDTFRGVDLGAGLQFNLRNITFGIDAVTTNFEITEVRLGIGVNWN